MLRGEKKKKSPKQWSKGTQNKLRKMKDEYRERDSKLEARRATYMDDPDWGNRVGYN